jgi:hypothetical protein
MPSPSERDENAWFPRFGDIPGISWSSPSIDRSRLPGHDARPEPSSYDGSTWWPMIGGDEDGETSATPAQQYGDGFGEAKTVADVLLQLGEALELPGNPSDYHFLIAEAQERLWRFRFREPKALAEIERLCFLDIELVRVRKGIIAPYREGEPTLYMAVFESLHRLYSKEGYLAELQEIQRMAVDEFDQRKGPRLDEVQERLALLEAEDA